MSSVKDLQDKFFVFTLADSNKVSMKAIEVSGRSGDDFIVKAGLKAGDKVAINSIDLLNDGVKVSPKLVATPTAGK